MAKNLAQRVEQNQRDQSGTGKSLQQQIRDMESQFALAMPKGAEAAQLVRDALTALRTNPKLARCEATSVLGGLMTCAQLGLRPGVLGHAWVLPFYSSRNKRYEAQLVIGYQGLVDLAHRSGRIASLIARTVYEADHFDVDYGLADSLVHKPALKGTRGEPVAYYAIAKFTTGGHAFIVVSHDDMTSYRDKYAMARNKQGQIVGPWVDEFEGMAHKTCVRQLSKWMPKSTELASALAVDGSVRVDMSTDADPTQVSQVIEGDVIDVEATEAGPTDADIAAMNAEADAQAAEQAAASDGASLFGNGDRS